MSFSNADDEGVNYIVSALEELSHEEGEWLESCNVLSSNDHQITRWIVNQAVQGERKSVCRRSAPCRGLKEQRSNTPWRTTSRQQMTRNHADFVEFKHHLNPKKYIDEYRNGKIIRQEASYREILSKTSKEGTLSEHFFERGKKCHKEELVSAQSRHVPSVVTTKEVQTTKDKKKSDKSLIVSSNGLSKFAHLPLSGQFQGKKLQWRSAINNRKIIHPKATKWNQASNDSFHVISSHGNDEISTKRVDCLPLDERKLSANLIVQQADLTAVSNSDLRAENKTLSIISKPIGVQYSPVEKYEAWVKDRNNELGTVSSSKAKEQSVTKGRTFRAYHTPQHNSPLLSLRGNSLASPQRDTCSTRSPDTASLGHPARSSAMDYSKYTDMFKNVLEFYGTRRLRPKSNSAVEELLFMKT